MNGNMIKSPIDLYSDRILTLYIQLISHEPQYTHLVSITQNQQKQKTSA
jgi:hypothetical protein